MTQETKDSEPVAFIAEGSHNGEVHAKQIYWTRCEAENAVAVFISHYEQGKIIPLYTAPHDTEALRRKQAIIDALMLEYCPDEMTLEQFEEWAKHQATVTDPTIGGE